MLVIMPDTVIVTPGFRPCLTQLKLVEKLAYQQVSVAAPLSSWLKNFKLGVWHCLFLFSQDRNCHPHLRLSLSPPLLPAQGTLEEGTLMPR
jgi:hypothetical protein